MYHIERYKRNPIVDFKERTWPDKQREGAYMVFIRLKRRQSGIGRADGGRRKNRNV